jgi:hypothetical protein
MTSFSNSSRFTRRTFLHATGVVVTLGSSLKSMDTAGARSLSSQDDLVHGFAHPPGSAKPRVYWWWLMSLVSKEGITMDLEQMAAKGIGGVLIFDAAGRAGPQAPIGPAFMTSGWRENFRHALQEADRLGLEVSVNLCSGWDAGGPWITPDHASKHFQQSTLNISGPRAFSGQLPKPQGDTPTYREIAMGIGQRPRTSLSPDQAHYREIAVQAFPRPSRDFRPSVQVTASSAQPAHPVERAVDNLPDTFWVSGGYAAGDGPTQERPEWISFEFDSPFTARTLSLLSREDYGPRTFHLQVSDDGAEFRTVKSFELDRQGAETLEFPETTARIYRFAFTASYSAENVQVRRAGLANMPLALSGEPSVSAELAIKSGRDSYGGVLEQGPIRRMVEAPLAVLQPEAMMDGQAVAEESIIDLTDRVRSDGTLEWDVPEGNWTIVRTGYACNNDQVMCAHPGAAGSSIDFLGKAAIEFHFEKTAEILLRDAGPLAGTTLKYLHIDSWEAGLPNWTDSFLDDFQKFRGYDPRPYLPVLAGYMVTNAEVSDRFLYDYRKTIGDCVAENHYRRLAELAHARGVQIHCQAGGPFYPRVPPFDALKNLGCSDIPMGEFWQSGHWKEHGDQHIAGKQTACAAHTYGKKYVAAEAFTSMGQWYAEDFADLKPTADKAFCEGFNLFFIHTYTSTRPEDGVPGFEYFAGTHFNRHVTWWPQAGAFLGYLGRCQYLLQQGLFVADVCYYNGDGTPNLVEAKQVDPSLGSGYDYDVCNADVLLTRMDVRGGRIVLPDGMNYHALVLPDRSVMPVEVLRKIGSLVAGGATVIGPRPQRAPGLQHYPQCDTEVQRLADEIWGNCDGQRVQENRYGNGRVIWGKPLRDILMADGVGPDFEWTGDRAETHLDFIHRCMDETEIYFVCNRNDRWEWLDAIFRVCGKQPELWDPVCGTIQAARAFRQLNGRTIIPLEFAPYGSCFVVFRKAIPGNAAGTHSANHSHWLSAHELGGAWDVSFDPKWGGPASVRFDGLVSWTTRPEPGIRHYSGKSTYHKAFDLPEGLGGTEQRLRLHLGVVRNVAEVRLNGRDLGVVWTDPFSVDVTDVVRSTDNQLEIDVVNLWSNRLIHDAALPAQERLTRSSRPRDPQEPLFDSGLLGPVAIQVEVKQSR